MLLRFEDLRWFTVRGPFGRMSEGTQGAPMRWLQPCPMTIDTRVVVFLMVAMVPLIAMARIVRMETRRVLTKVVVEVIMTIYLG